MSQLDSVAARRIALVPNAAKAARAEAAFRARLAELGAELLEPYHGIHSKHQVRCAAGHPCLPCPIDVRRGQGICRTCARNDPARAEAAFRARLAELGAELLEPRWRGSDVPHQVRCAAGHLCSPRPNGVRKGQGICRKCAGQIWDAFYIVRDPNNGHVKFGITSGDPRPRLGEHHTNGYRDQVLILTGLPDGLAHRLEVGARAILMASGIEPIRGREYFEAAALPLVLAIVDAFADEIPSASRIAAV